MSTTVPDLDNSGGGLVSPFAGDGALSEEDEDEAYRAEESAGHESEAGQGDEGPGSDLSDEEFAGSEEEIGGSEEEGAGERVRAALREGLWSVAVRLMVASGVRDENRLTNLIFHARHPELAGRSIGPGEGALAAQWRQIRDDIVRPLLGQPQGVRTRPALLSERALREAWRAYRGAREKMTTISLFGWNTPVNPETVEAWKALERALLGAGYQPHRAWVFVDRTIKGKQAASLHAYGLAVDIDHRRPVCNVNRRTPDRRPVRFSTASTKDGRCADVRNGSADTSFTPEQVAAVEAVRTVDGHQVFTWGGRWKTTKDTMHFQLNVTPEELRRGIRQPSGEREWEPMGTAELGPLDTMWSEAEGLFDRARAAARDALDAVKTRLRIAQGTVDENDLTNLVFFDRHPGRTGTRLTNADPDFARLSAEWRNIRDRIVRPALRAASTPRYDRAGAIAYARKYWLQPCDDQFIAIGGSTGPSRKVPPGTRFVHEFAADGVTPLPREHALLPDGSRIAWDDLDDCTHFISCCIGERPGEQCGGLKLTHQQLGSPPNAPYGIVRVSTMVDYLTGRLAGHPARYAEIVAERSEDDSLVTRLAPGDLVAYFSKQRGRYSHLALLLPGNKIACHTYGRSDQPACTWDNDWDLGRGTHQWTFLRFVV